MSDGLCSQFVRSTGDKTAFPLYIATLESYCYNAKLFEFCRAHIGNLQLGSYDVQQCDSTCSETVSTPETISATASRRRVSERIATT